MSQFSQPGIANPEDKFTPAEHFGALLLFFPTDVQREIPTQHGTADAVKARVVNLNSGKVMDDALIFPQALVTQLKAAVPDGMVLGRLGQGENKKGNPPWLLQPHTEQDVAVAEQWLSLNPRNQFQQAAPPTPAASAPQATPAWGQQAAPAPATGGWAQAAAHPAPPAPVANTPQAAWNAAPATPTPAPQAGWQAPAAVAAPAPAAPAPAPTATSNIHPGLVEALRKKGVVLQPGQTQQDAESIWTYVANNPDVA